MAHKNSNTDTELGEIAEEEFERIRDAVTGTTPSDDEKTYKLTEEDLQRIFWHANRLASGNGADIDGMDILNVLFERLGIAEMAPLQASTFNKVINETLYEDEELARSQREELLARIEEQKTE